MQKTGLTAIGSFFVTLFFFTSSWATPLLEYTETYNGTEYLYDFTLTNDDVSLIDELFVEFNISDPFADFVSASSPAGWDYFDGLGYDLNPVNNYWVGWTAWFGSELGVLQSLPSFSITTLTQVDNFDFSWNWDRFNVSVASDNAPVPEPATMILFGTGVAALMGTGIRKKKHS